MIKEMCCALLLAALVMWLGWIALLPAHIRRRAYGEDTMTDSHACWWCGQTATGQIEIEPEVIRKKRVDGQLADVTIAAARLAWTCDKHARVERKPDPVEQRRDQRRAARDWGLRQERLV